MIDPRPTITSPTDPTDLLRKLDQSLFTRRHAVIYGTLLTGHFLDGFVINLTGVVLPGVIKTFHISSQQAGFLSSALFLGMLVGAAVAGLVSDRLGRKFPLAVCLLVFAAFSLLAAFSWDYSSLVTARICQGVGLGAEIAVVLPYITEFVPSRHRAPLVTTATAAWLIGLPVAALVGTAVVPSLSWRAMFVIGTVPVVVSVVMMATLPESVRYLLRTGRHDAALRIVGGLAVGSAPGSATAPAGRTAPAVPAVSTAGPEPDVQQRTAGSVRKLLDASHLRYTVSLWFMEICAGAFLYGMSTWLPSILEKKGVSVVGSFTYTAIITASGVVGAIIAGHIVNRVGRRTTIGFSFLLSAVLCLGWGSVSSTTAVLVLGSLATFFGSGFAGSTLFVYASELYPTINRATGLGWAAAFQKVGGLIIPTVIGWVIAVHSSNFLFFVLFAVISALAGISGLVATFETRGRTIEQISVELNRRTRVSLSPVTEFGTTYEQEQAGEG
jgi:putative MFS transporter